MNEPELIQRILDTAKTIAVVGLSEKRDRPSHHVAEYLQQQGYRIVPVNPQAQSATILGQKVYRDLDQACAAEKVDVVEVFRAPMFVPEVVKDTMRLKVPYLWLQEGVMHEEAADWAEKDGIGVVMDRCMLKEHAALARRHAAR